MEEPKCSMNESIKSKEVIMKESNIDLLNKHEDDIMFNEYMEFLTENEKY